VVKALALGASLARGMGSNPIACINNRRFFLLLLPFSVCVVAPAVLKRYSHSHRVVVYPGKLCSAGQAVVLAGWQVCAERGCSSLGRAVGSQSAGTGIETLLLQIQLFFCFPPFPKSSLFCGVHRLLAFFCECVSVCLRYRARATLCVILGSRSPEDDVLNAPMVYR
jgi:hypothetical protein